MRVRRGSRWPDFLIRVVFALLALLGVTAAVLRSVAPDDVLTRMEPFRTRMINAFGVTEPEPDRRAHVVADGKFAAHRAVTRIHVLSGAGFLALAALQLARRVRTRTPKVHRVSGRIAISLAWLSGLTGLFFGLWQPLGGIAEQVIVGVAGLFLLVAVSVGFRHIRAGRAAAHREWMLRGTAAALAIAAIRVVAIPLDLALTPHGVDIRVVFVLSLWLGWCVTLAGAEWWIRRTRPVDARDRIPRAGDRPEPGRFLEHRAR
jgi:uncharacterized membrane protein